MLYLSSLIITIWLRVSGLCRREKNIHKKYDDAFSVNVNMATFWQNIVNKRTKRHDNNWRMHHKRR